MANAQLADENGGVNGNSADSPAEIAAARARADARGLGSGSLLPGWVSPILNDPNDRGLTVESESVNGAFFRSAVPGKK